MDCPACGRFNREGARFCRECGGTLAVCCAGCGAELPPDARFCDGCGQRVARAAAVAVVDPPTVAADPSAYTPPHLAKRILRDRGGLQGERRTVTVLVADAVGSTGIGERLDEEVVYGIMQRCVALMMEAVHRYEGVVTQFRGDGIMALFGAPIAHEDAARRAVAAGLAMQQALTAYGAEVERRHGLALRFRVGINTGPVVVGAISDSLAMDYTAIGDTVNLAARMEELAEPGAVCLSEATERAVRDYVECAPLGTLAVKGKAEPVPAYRAVRETGVRGRLEAASGRGLTPYVGRERELSLLRGAFEQAAAGRGQVVFIAGEAGIGKSRLLLEFRRELTAQATWLEGRCISYGAVIPYLPVIELLKNAFGITEGDDEAAIVARVDAATAAWDTAARATVPYLRFLLAVDPGDAAVATMDPQERRAGIFDGLRALLGQESRRAPLVIVLEDLHWIDEKAAEALGVLADVTATTPVLLILTHRPGYASALGERAYTSRLALGHLPAAESAAIARAVAGGDALPEEVQALVTAKAEGNPFYVEEVTRSLLELGVLARVESSYRLQRPLDSVRVPDTIQEVILARIDRLDRQAREALQLASVIGREFTVRLLQRISDLSARLEGLLTELKALELIYERAYFPELAYMFKHALTHDVAYSTLLLERRKALHRLVARSIEELYADRLPEHYETLAHHYEAAEDWEKALRYLDLAGDKAAAAFANRAALDYYARALAACDRLGAPALSRLNAIAQKRGWLSTSVDDVESARADLDRAAAAARALGDRHAEAMARIFEVLNAWGSANWAWCFATLEDVLRQAADDWYDVRLFASAFLGELHGAFNRHGEARRYFDLAAALVDRVDDPMVRGSYALFTVFPDQWTAHFDQALAHVERWRDVVEAARQSYMSLIHQWAEALARAGQGEYEQAIRLLQDSMVTAEREGVTIELGRALNTLGWVYAELQDHQRALTLNTRGIQVAMDVNLTDFEMEGNSRVNLGDNLFALGRWDEAEEQFQVVERVVRDESKPWFNAWRYGQHLFHSYGELWLARGDTEKALAYAEDCLALAEGSDSRKNIVKGRRLRGQALMARGDHDAAEAELTAALELAREVHNPPQLWKTLAALGELRQARGDHEAARAAYQESFAVIERVADDLADERARETLLTSSQVQAIACAAGRQE